MKTIFGIYSTFLAIFLLTDLKSPKAIVLIDKNDSKKSKKSYKNS